MHPNYIGVDVSETALKGLGKKGMKCDFNKEKLPFENNSIDAIVSFWVLEHIYEIEHLLNECNRVLAENGVLILNNTWIYSSWVYPDKKFPKKDFLKYGIMRVIDELKLKLKMSIKLRVERRTPDYTSIEPDADACSLIDPHNVYCCFKSKGYVALNENKKFWKGIRHVFNDDNNVVVVKKCTI